MYRSRQTSFTPVTARYCLHHIVSFKHGWSHLQYLSLLNWNGAARVGVMVWDWPSRLSGEGSIPPWFYFHLSAHNGNEVVLVQCYERSTAGGEKNGNAGYSSTCITCFIYSNNGMWTLHGGGVSTICRNKPVNFRARAIFSLSNQKTDQWFLCWWFLSNDIDVIKVVASIDYLLPRVLCHILIGQRW